MSGPALTVPYDFEEFERRAVQRRRSRMQRLTALRGACALALLVGVALAWLGTRPSPLAAEPALGSRAAQVWLAEDPILAALGRRDTVVRVETRLSALALEERIALVDDLLSDAHVGSDPLSRLHGLEQERALLIDSLVRVRRAEALLHAAN